MNVIGHKVELFVRDLDASVTFYRDVLLFDEGEERQTVIEGKLHRHVPLWKGDLILALGPMESLPENHHLRRAGLDVEFGIGLELCLYVDDAELDDVYAHVCKVAQTGVGELRLRPWGLRDFRIVDPDGYYIRITPPDRDVRQR